MWEGTAELIVRDPDGRVACRATGHNTVTNFGFWGVFAGLGNTGLIGPILLNGNQSGLRWLGSNGTAPDWFDGSVYYRPVNPWAFLYVSTDSTAPSVATNTLPGGQLIAAASGAGNTSYSWPFNGASQSCSGISSTAVQVQSATSILVTVVFDGSTNPNTLTVGSIGFSPGMLPNSTSGANITTVNWAANLITNSSSPASTADLVIASKLIPSSTVTIANGQQLTVNYTLNFAA